MRRRPSRSCRDPTGARRGLLLTAPTTPDGPEGEIARLGRQARIVAALEDAAFRSLGLPDEGRVLDVGCGPGFVAARLMAGRPGLRVVGVDRDPELLARASASVDTVQADAENLPFAPGPEPA